MEEKGDLRQQGFQKDGEAKKDYEKPELSLYDDLRIITANGTSPI